MIVQVNGITPWFGAIGLGMGQGNFSVEGQATPMNESTESLLDALLTAGDINGRSWGYTAGASYREHHLLALPFSTDIYEATTRLGAHTMGDTLEVLSWEDTMRREPLR